MKIKELIEILEHLPGDHEVVMSRDSEGNGFSPLYECDVAKYVPDSTWSGELAVGEPNAVILRPVN